MAIVRWNHFNDLDRLQRRINRMFDDSIFRSYSDEENSVYNWQPQVDIFEDENGIALSTELPGMDQKDIKVNVENNVLTLSGERKLENEDKREGYTRIERFYGTFSRSFTLPSTVDVEKIAAKMDKGVLKVTLPKKEETKPKQIEVKVN